MDRKEQINPLEPTERWPAGKELEPLTVRPYRNKEDELACYVVTSTDFDGDLCVELFTVNRRTTGITLPINNFKLDHVMQTVERYLADNEIDILK